MTVTEGKLFDRHDCDANDGRWVHVFATDERVKKPTAVATELVKSGRAEWDNDPPVRP